MKVRSVQWNLKRAASNHLLIVEPQSKQLQLDLDGARALRRYGKQFAILKKAGLTKNWREKITESKKRGHVHVTIDMPHAVKNLERVTLQAILGSDIIREAFNYVRVKRRNKYPIVFFERAGND